MFDKNYLPRIVQSEKDSKILKAVLKDIEVLEKIVEESFLRNQMNMQSKSIEGFIKKASDQSEAHKQLIHVLWDGTKVFLVDGNWVRDNINDEFIGGGHYFQDDYIPKGEIWSERVEDPVDNKEILIHEIIEYIFMRYENKDYDTSHDIANSVEDTIRRLPDSQGDPLPLTLYQKRKETGGNDDKPGNSMNTGIETSDKAASFEDRVSFVVHMEGHKNSKGESAPWVIKSHETGKILSSHKTKEEAKKHLKQMHIHKGESIMEFRNVKNIDDMLKKAEESDLKLFYFKNNYGAEEITGRKDVDPIVAAHSEEEAWNILIDHIWSIDRSHDAYNSGEYSSKEEFSNDIHVVFEIIRIEPIPSKPGIVVKWSSL